MCHVIRQIAIVLIFVAAYTVVAQEKRPSAVLGEDGFPVYQYWLDDDVRWIITDHERAVFARLQSDEERDAFIDQFWLRRDPTPNTHDNEYEDEYYRRLAYANEHLGGSQPGRFTDRGRIYALFGNPDSITDSIATDGVPVQRWVYRFIEGVGQNQTVEFRDPCRCKEFRIFADPLRGRSYWETLWGKDSLQAADRLIQAPTDRFRNLARVIAGPYPMRMLEFAVGTEVTPVTRATNLVRVTVTIKNADLSWRTEDSRSRATLEIFGRVTSLAGRVAATIEANLEPSVPAPDLTARPAEKTAMTRVLVLRPGRYRLDFVVRDLNGEKVSLRSQTILVPEPAMER